MLIRTEYVITEFQRSSKTGQLHSYSRKKTVLVFACDNCNSEFCRERGSMSPERMSNNYYHVCTDCNIKKFAQEKSVEKRLFWNLPVSSLKTVDQS